MSRHPAADLWKVMLSLAAGPIAFAVLFVGLMALGSYCAGRASVESPKASQIRHTIRAADSTAKVRTDTVIIYRDASVKAKARSDSAKQVSDSLDAKVGIVDDSTLHVQESPDSIHVPLIVIENLRSLRMTVATQDTTIQRLTTENVGLWARDTTRQWQIATRDKLIRELSRQNKCGRRCGFLLGAASVAGVVYLVK